MAKPVLALLLLALVTSPGCSSAGRLSGSSAAARPPAAVSDTSAAAHPLVDVSDTARPPMTIYAAPSSALDNSPAATRAVYSYPPRRPAGWFCCGPFCCNGYRPTAITVPTSSSEPRSPVAVSDVSTEPLEDSDNSPAATVHDLRPLRPAGWFCCGPFCCNGYRPRAITVPTSSVGPRPPVAVSDVSTAQLEDSDSPGLGDAHDAIVNAHGRGDIHQTVTRGNSEAPPPPEMAPTTSWWSVAVAAIIVAAILLVGLVIFLCRGRFC